MAFDVAFWDQHYDTVYELGVPAMLVTSGTDGGEYDVTVVDKSTNASSRSNISTAELIVIHSARAVAAVRVTELSSHGLVRDDLSDAMITFNGSTWRVKATEPFSSPVGFDHGELYLVLVDDG